MQTLTIDILGYLGSFLLIAGFLLSSAGKLAPSSMSYQELNLLGAGLIVINAWFHGAMPSVVVNVFWMGAAGVFLARKALVKPKIKEEGK